MKKMLVSSVLAITLVLWGSSEALAWKTGSRFNVTLFNHRFYAVYAQTATDGRCYLVVSVRFYAPTNLFYRFQAKVKFQGGGWVKSASFGNNYRGTREYSFKFKTERCWSKKSRSITHLTVYGCRGWKCSIP